MKPLFKWSGGKSKELIHIKKHLPIGFNVYFEPFLGGGSLWFDLMPNKSIVNDNYKDVSNFYKVLKLDTEKLINHINSLSTAYNESKKDSKEDMIELSKKFYYYYRDSNFESDFDKAVKFYMLRQLSFSGMLRFSNDGNYNVPYGWYKTMKIIDQPSENLIKMLNNSIILNENWKEAIKDSTICDFVFLDPPYTRKFQKYHPNGSFGEQEHIKLAEWFKNKQSRVLIVINKDEFTTSLYKDFIVEEYGKKYSIQYRDRMKEEDSNAVHFIAKNY